VSLVTFRRCAVSMQWSAVVQKPGDRAMAHFPRGRFFDPGMGLSGRRILIPSFGPGSFPLTAQTPPYLVFKAWWSVVFLCCSLDVLIDGYVVCLFVSSYCVRPLCGHGIYIHDPVSPPPGRDQLMRLPHPLPIRPLEKTKAKTKTIINPGLDSAPSSWDHPRSTPVPALPAPRSPTSTPTSYILALRPHARLVLHAHSIILVVRPTVISTFLQIAP
jgi:hypothetical protein